MYLIVEVIAGRRYHDLHVADALSSIRLVNMPEDVQSQTMQLWKASSECGVTDVAAMHVLSRIPRGVWSHEDCRVVRDLRPRFYAAPGGAKPNAESWQLAGRS